MTERDHQYVQIGLMVIILILLATNVALFLRMTNYQSDVLTALARLDAGQGNPAAAGGPVPGGPQDLPGPPEGDPAPAFTLATADGGSVSLEDYVGDGSGGDAREPLVLLFSSVTCPACERAYPEVAAFREAHPDLPLVMVSRGSHEDHRKLAEEHGFDFPIAQWEDAVAQGYKVPGTPYAIQVTPEGTFGPSGVVFNREALERVAGH